MKIEDKLLSLFVCTMLAIVVGIDTKSATTGVTVGMLAFNSLLLMSLTK